MSAVGTALGPSLGGVLIAALGWQALFLVNLPLGGLAFWLAKRSLPDDKPVQAVGAQAFDYRGALLLAVTLAAYALAMTIGRGNWGLSNIGLLAISAVGLLLFVRSQASTPEPLIRLALLRNAALRSSLAMNALVSTVMMATLVVGPFYLSHALGLQPSMVGVVMSVGPLISVLCGVVAGRMVDRWGTAVMTAAGLIAMLLGALALSAIPAAQGIAGYVAGIAILTPGYQLFQAANNTAVMADVAADQRGLISGVLTLSRNLGLITGASVMGAVFAFATHTTDITSAKPQAVADGMHITFGMATLAVGIALGLALTALRAKRSGAVSAGIGL